MSRRSSAASCRWRNLTQCSRHESCAASRATPTMPSMVAQSSGPSSGPRCQSACSSATLQPRATSRSARYGAASGPSARPESLVRALMGDEPRADLDVPGRRRLEREAPIEAQRHQQWRCEVPVGEGMQPIGRSEIQERRCAQSSGVARRADRPGPNRRARSSPRSRRRVGRWRGRCRRSGPAIPRDLPSPGVLPVRPPAARRRGRCTASAGRPQSAAPDSADWRRCRSRGRSGVAWRRPPRRTGPRARRCGRRDRTARAAPASLGANLLKRRPDRAPPRTPAPHRPSSAGARARSPHRRRADRAATARS